MIIIPERSALPGHRHAKDTSHLGQIRRRLLEPTVGVEANDGGLVAVPTEFWVSMASELNNRPSRILGYQAKQKFSPRPLVSTIASTG
ncbi:MAG: hypothetical protein QOI25_5202 [Mycobacterium sp.]|jgi:hypothetical protein|nr:hypothetical protein [Mycobacterium sp.]